MVFRNAYKKSRKLSCQKQQFKGPDDNKLAPIKNEILTGHGRQGDAMDVMEVCKSMVSSCAGVGDDGHTGAFNGAHIGDISKLLDHSDDDEDEGTGAQDEEEKEEIKSRATSTGKKGAQDKEATPSKKPPATMHFDADKDIDKAQRTGRQSIEALANTCATEKADTDLILQECKGVAAELSFPKACVLCEIRARGASCLMEQTDTRLRQTISGLSTHSGRGCHVSVLNDSSNNAIQSLKYVSPCPEFEDVRTLAVLSGFTEEYETCADQTHIKQKTEMLNKFSRREVLDQELVAKH